MWVRGLKLYLVTTILSRRSVAPYVGAWIETTLLDEINPNRQSHPMWVRGLKHQYRNNVNYQ